MYTCKNLNLNDHIYTIYENIIQVQVHVYACHFDLSVEFLFITRLGEGGVNACVYNRLKRKRNSSIGFKLMMK